VIEHERLHCQGYDHPGESTMRNILARFNARQALANRDEGPLSASAGASSE
jgi:hypothetical protein